MAKKSSTKSQEKQTAKKVKGVPTPHDHFFRHTFLQRDHAQEFLASYLPKDLLIHLKLDELALESASYIDERLSEHLSDVLYEIPLAQASSETVPVSVYMLFEHKSGPEQQVLLQLLRYMYERWMADNIDGKQIRPIIPIVFYHGQKNWTVPTQFIDQFKGVDKIFHAFIPDFQYILFDTSEYEGEQIRQAISSGSLQAALLLLKYIYDQTLEEKLEEVLDPLAKSELASKRMLDQLYAMLSYIANTSNPVNEHRLRDAVQSKFVEEEDAVNTILVDIWLERGILKGMRRTIRQILEHKFGQKEDSQKTIDEIGSVQSEENKSISDLMREVARRLEYVSTESELSALTNIVLTAPELATFLRYLPLEMSSNQSDSEAEIVEIRDGELEFAV